MVVFPFSSTSNHNNINAGAFYEKLYFLSLLHQTTTANFCLGKTKSCISFLFYIKPQHVRSKRLELSFI